MNQSECHCNNYKKFHISKESSLYKKSVSHVFSSMRENITKGKEKIYILVDKNS